MALRLRGVRRRHGYRETLRGIDFDVERGACVVIRGPNGAGKSTILRVVATQWRASAGSGSVFGFDLDKQQIEARRRVGAVFHQSFLRPEFSLEENLRFAADLYDVDASSSLRRVERLGLGMRLHDRVSTFSQGMTKRASIARSLVHSPPLWLLDEPFSGLDPSGRDLLREMLVEYLAEGGTVVLVTHHQELTRDLASDIWEVDDGKMRRVTEVEDSGGAP